MRRYGTGGKGFKVIRRRTRKRIMTGIICLIVLLLIGCSEKREKNETQDSSQSSKQIEDGVREDETHSEDTASEDTSGSKEESGQEKTDQNELRQAATPQFIPNGIRGVSLKKDGQEFLRISREPAAYKMSFDYWEILNPYDENATMNTEVMFEMFEELCSLSFTEAAQIEDGIDTGIKDSDTGIVVEYVDTTDDSYAKSVDQADTAAEIILGKEDGSGGRYAAAAVNIDNVFILPEETLQMIYARKPFDYILKIPVLISADTLKAVEISADGRKYEIKVDTAEDSYRFGKKRVKKDEFAALYQSISGIKLVTEIDQTDQEKRDKKEDPELSVVYRRNTNEAPEVCVSYYPYDTEFDSVEIGGKERFLVRKEEVERLIGEIKEVF